MYQTSTNITQKYCQEMHYNCVGNSGFCDSDCFFLCSPLLHYHYVSTSLTMQIPTETLSQTHRVCFMLLCYRKANRTNSYGNAIANSQGLLHAETGFSYFGARYYDSDLMTGWLSVDPMADKYPNISPYAYCAWTRPTGADEHRLIEFNIANNPVKLVDPDGRDTVYINKNGEESARKPGGNSTFIDINNNWEEVPMPGVILQRSQTGEKTIADSYQKYDHLIAAATGYFNHEKNEQRLDLYTDGNNKIPSSESHIMSKYLCKSRHFPIPHLYQLPITLYIHL